MALDLFQELNCLLLVNGQIQNRAKIIQYMITKFGL